MIRRLFTEHKGVFKFLGVFLGCYLLLSALYLGYINITTKDGHIDPITRLVGLQSEMLINQWGYQAQVVPQSGKPSLQLYVNGDYVARIIEGCNAVSIIILFTSFVVAFRKSFKETAIFIFAGSVLIYAINLLRIAILAIALYEYPEKEALLHQVIFPGIIYGFVALLWMIWVGVFNKKQKV